jgi:hemolysin type calcium-binding protein
MFKVAAVVGVMVSVALAAPAAAAPPDPVDDGRGKEWRQLYETSGISPATVAQLCPRDGATPCSGSVGARSLSGWVWATADQVVGLFGNYDPAIVGADPPQTSDYGPVLAFLADMRQTGTVSGYGFFSEWAVGWTASVDEAGEAISGRAGWGWWPPGGGFIVSGATEAFFAQDQGVFLWRDADADHSPPAVVPTVTGTLGTNGWYRSDAAVSWAVSDAESEVVSQTGCEPATVSEDTAGMTFTCEATSAGGTGSASTTVRRDTTAPAVTCGSATFELYQLGARVQATVEDATSGPLSPLAQAAANTNAIGTFAAPVTGVDRAGNRTTVPCAYTVAVPTCNGQTPTIVGTAANNTITGTEGRDVIVGLGGADVIKGRGGNDVICGGDGPDTIEGGDGDDYIDGGAGSDSIRGDGGRDTCLSGEARTSSCEA